MDRFRDFGVAIDLKGRWSGSRRVTPAQDAHFLVRVRDESTITRECVETSRMRIPVVLRGPVLSPSHGGADASVLPRGLLLVMPTESISVSSTVWRCSRSLWEYQSPRFRRKKSATDDGLIPSIFQTARLFENSLPQRCALDLKLHLFQRISGTAPVPGGDPRLARLPHTNAKYQSIIPTFHLVSPRHDHSCAQIARYRRAPGDCGRPN
jgi:hypothetical protein